MAAVTCNQESASAVLAFRALASFQKRAWGLWFSAMQTSRPLLLLKAVLQCRALRSGKSRVLPASGNSPPSPSLHQLPQAVLMTVGQAHPRISQMPGLFPAQHSWEGSALGAGWGGENHTPPPWGPLFSGPGPRGWSPGEGRATLACACRGAGSEQPFPPC